MEFIFFWFPLELKTLRLSWIFENEKQINVISSLKVALFNNFDTVRPRFSDLLLQQNKTFVTLNGLADLLVILLLSRDCFK